MDSPFFVTYTGCDDLHLVCTRHSDGTVQIVATSSTHELADGIAASKNLDELLNECTQMVNHTDLTTDENLAALSEAVNALHNLVDWEMKAYYAKGRIQDAKDLAAGIIELEATA